MSSNKPQKCGSSNLLARRPINIITANNSNDKVTHRLSPQSHLRHYHYHHGMPTFNDTRRRSCGNVGNLQRCNSSDNRRLSLSRDAQQPSSGSLLNLRCQSLPPESEEADVLESLFKTRLSLHSFSNALSGNRPRSFTCSDLDSKKKKSKVKNRPPTPPPSTTLPAEIPLPFPKSSSLDPSRYSRSFDSSSPVLGHSASHFHHHQPFHIHPPTHPYQPSFFNSPMFGMGRRSRHSSREKIEANPLEDTLPVINES